MEDEPMTTENNNIDIPARCTICGYYLTTFEQYAGNRCVDPGHWQAAGALTPSDFYPMARIAAWANSERNQRTVNRDSPILGSGAP